MWLSLSLLQSHPFSANLSSRSTALFPRPKFTAVRSIPGPTEWSFTLSSFDCSPQAGRTHRWAHGHPARKNHHFPQGALLCTGTAPAVLVNKAEMLNYFSGKPWIPEQVITRWCLIAVASLAPHFQKQHRHGLFLPDFGLLNLPGSSERNIHSI